MSKHTGYARNIFFSIIISIIILLGLGFLSIKYLVPIYDLQSQDIYQFLIYLLPVILGLALIEIGSIIASQNNDKTEDSEDLLPKNSYDAPLFNTINDDPATKQESSNFTSIENLENGTYSFRDSLDEELANKIDKYNNCELVSIFEQYELNKNSTKVNSPFDEELTAKLFKLSNNEARKALNWIDNDCPTPVEGAVVLNNLNQDTLDSLSKLSQREASLILNIISENSNYVNLAHLSESSRYALSNLNDEQVANAINWINLGSPRAADPNARVYDNLDKDTLLRLEAYNSIQVNVGLDYIDDGAPDIENPNSVLLPNLAPKTIERITLYSDSELNESLDKSENELFAHIDSSTLERISNYSEDQINSGLNYIDDGAPTSVNTDDVLLPNILPNTIERLSYFSDTELNESLDKFESELLSHINPSTIQRIDKYDDEQINSGLNYIDEGQPISIQEDLPFGEEINRAIISFTFDEAKAAVNYIRNKDKFGELSNIVEDLPFGDDINHAIRSFSPEEAANAVNYIKNKDKFADISNKVEDLPFGDTLNHAIRSFTPEEAENAVNYVKNIDSLDFSLGDISNNFEDFLNSELKDNQSGGFNFDISIAVFDKDNVLSNEDKETILSKLPAYTYIYDTKNNNKAIVFPYENGDKAKSCISSILKEHSTISGINNIKIGYASQNNRSLDAKALIDEAYNN